MMSRNLQITYANGRPLAAYLGLPEMTKQELSPLPAA